jgi:hypothetical protein
LSLLFLVSLAFLRLLFVNFLQLFLGLKGLSRRVAKRKGRHVEARQGEGRGKRREEKQGEVGNRIQVCCA